MHYKTDSLILQYLYLPTGSQRDGHGRAAAYNILRVCYEHHLLFSLLSSLELTPLYFSLFTTVIISSESVRRTSRPLSVDL